jgi:hypothetical protein
VSALAIAVGLTGTLALGRVAGRAIEVFGGVAVPGGLARCASTPAVIGLVIVVTIVPYLIFALLPLIGLARVDPADALSSSRVAGGLRLARTRQLLMAVQVAVAVALLGQGSLLLQSVRAMMTADLGFDSEAVLKAHVLLPRTTYLDRASQDHGNEPDARADRAGTGRNRCGGGSFPTPSVVSPSHGSNATAAPAMCSGQRRP